jgi:hypothetical protein
VIATDGSVAEIARVKSYFMLPPAVIAAVWRWRFRQTFLSGQAVGIAIDIHREIQTGGFMTLHLFLPRWLLAAATLALALFGMLIVRLRWMSA